jgi:hypothetical protein
VIDRGNIADTFGVRIGDATWPTGAPGTVGPLAPHSSTTVVVTVSVPADATDGATDTAAITVTSWGDDSKSTTVRLTTAAEAAKPLPYHLSLPLVMR